MLIVSNSYGALSATSVNTIKGSAPTFTGQSGANKLGFKVGSTLYSEGKGNIVGGTEKIFEPSLRLNEFKVQTSTVNDFSVSTDYYDADGDAAHPTTPFTVGSLTYNWYDRNGTEITDYTKMVGCSGLRHPLTLKISLLAQAHSRYGKPRESSLVPLTKEYKIGTTTGICFAKPNQMIAQPGYTWVGTDGSTWYWNNASYKNRNQYGGGYDSTQFDPVNGFKASLSTKFPTTGFPKASFNLIMTSNPTDYTFTHNGGSAVTVGTNGKVTLNSKPSGPVIIKAKLNGTSQVHEYTFDPRSVWVVPKSGSRNYASAVSTCGGTNKIPSRAQLTNSPFNNAAQGWSYKLNVYTRAVGGGVFGEWGVSDGSSSYNTYPGSQWVYNSYWTRAPWSTSTQFYVGSHGGRVYYDSTGNSIYVACLE
ncbi:hypothetical protein RCS94_05625 [Orbaceae bacterium ac157xtp]